VVASATKVSDDSTSVVEVGVELVTCQLMECTLCGTSVGHPQYYLLNVLTRASFSSPLLLPTKFYRYPLVQSCQSQER
jgi:hypothetical protein